MCGFTGVVSFNKIDQKLVENSNKISICRGPDSLTRLSGNEELNYELIFNRLAIVDLNNNANQPMYSKKFNSVIMFNGEIYNSRELRNELDNLYEFTTSHSDTETLFAGLNIYGIDFINRIEGQFSIFYWKKFDQKIYLIKDRIGQKPLYYNLSDNKLNFGSNLKSIYQLNQKNTLDRDLINEYLLHGVNFSPNTIFKEIKSLNEGSYLEIDYVGGRFRSKLLSYWAPSSFVENKNFNEKEFLDIFHSSVSKRLFSDVPIACFLSGGLDSTSIVKSLNDSGNTINTFSVVTDKSEINEKKYIDKVVQKYDTKHTEVEVSSKISNQLVYKSLDSLDEPYGDPSIVPTYLLSNLISSSYKVALSGDGGDELLGGYERMLNHLKKRNRFDIFLASLDRFYPSIFGSGIKLKSRSQDLLSSYFGYLKDENFGSLLFEKNYKENTELIDLEEQIYKSIMCNEYKFYLSNQMMFKIDRASMANSLEVRSPFVDHKLVEYSLGHSVDYLSPKLPKKILIQYLSSDFEDNFLHRPKQGFVFDYKTWVFSNLTEIYELIESSEIGNFYNLDRFFKLKNIKSRINSLRIWRVFVLANYLSRIKSQ